ncbi:MAG TPA: type II toxin-antitoxin system Phd/YefM family antitoxin [Aggregatilineales bacterium]|nr:type II toxin-antitoxin system Phd/YefM family antitoxin [Aggregatilineales bacterium]
MTKRTTYLQACANFAKLCDEVAENQEIVIIQRRGAQDVALISASELSSLLETVHLLQSPANGIRLLSALARAQERIVET